MVHGWAWFGVVFNEPLAEEDVFWLNMGWELFSFQKFLANQVWGSGNPSGLLQNAQIFCLISSQLASIVVRFV